MAQLYFYYSAMNAGKSTHLLQSNYNYRERGMNCLLFTAQIDDRFQQGIKNMQTLVINKYDYVRSTLVGSDTTSYNPVLRVS